MIAAVTGARGLIGRYIVDGLFAAAWSVRVLSRNSDIVTEDELTVAVIQGDINDEIAVAKLVNGVDAVFHCAAELSDESTMLDVNVNGTKVLLGAMKLVPTIKYFCHLSSAGVIGPVSSRVVDEQSECEPNNLYERSKYEAEQLVLKAELAMSVTILRPANVFDKDKPGLVSYGLTNSFKSKWAVFFKGNEGAHLVHAKDVSAAALFFMDRTFVKPEVFFVSYDHDERNTVLGIYHLCCSMVDVSRCKVSWALPNIVPYMIRKLRKGKSLHGNVRFSGEKLKETGFVFPMGLEQAVADVCLK